MCVCVFSKLIVCANGTAAINFEHSWGDGVSVLRLANEIVEDARPVAKQQLQLQQQQQNNHQPQQQQQQQQATFRRVEWRVDDELKRAIDASVARYTADVGELSIQALKISGFGKSFFKARGIAPDGCVQQAIQLAMRKAYPRLQRPVATYESASTAAFKHGRTETIRPATKESASCIGVFLDAGTSRQERAAALRRAAERHRALSLEATLGQGADRHLFALRRVAALNGRTLPELYFDPAYARVNHNILSTSTLVRYICI